MIPWEKATELSGRHCGRRDDLVLDSSSELLGHKRGWIWAVYYHQGKLRSHFALIHSDGTPLNSTVANEIITADRACGGNLHELNCLNPLFIEGTDADISDALASYKQYLINECGFIQFDGLPVDPDVGPLRPALENLFVPVHVDIINSDEEELTELKRATIGEALREHQHIVVLAAPGGGKSTLIKRLAVAYIDAARRKQIDDALPENDWLPLFFRCRELRELARGSFSDLLQSLAERDPVRHHARAFRTLLDRAVLAGRVLLLVDGLDEIADAGDRAAFAGTLRSAIQAYPKMALVVTSREAGFRDVAAHLAPLCTPCTLSPFNANDILLLSEKWHTQLTGDNDKALKDAHKLAAKVIDDGRIRRLASNPLLLTTFLLVKRWAGSLPTRRALLYGKAVDVLLMTWNTEGYKPMRPDQTLPQLCYVAAAMMVEGVQKISRKRLADLIQESRTALQARLGNLPATVDEFINQIEDRSSLLMMSGLDVEDAQLVQFFEFRHLTFQEFLTARAMVEGWHRDQHENTTLADALRAHLQEERWREVIPLAAVLGGTAAESLISELSEQIAALDSRGFMTHSQNSLIQTLVRCLVDEATARPEVIRTAIQQLVRFGAELFSWDLTGELARGRYRDEFREAARTSYFTHTGNYINGRYALLAAVSGQASEYSYATRTELFHQWMRDSSSVKRCEGALGFIGRLIRESVGYYGLEHNSKWFSRAWYPAVSMLSSNIPKEEHVAAWLVGLLGQRIVEPFPTQPDFLGRLFTTWQLSNDTGVRNTASWALANQPVVPRDQSKHFQSITSEEIVRVLDGFENLLEDGGHSEKSAAVVVAWYKRAIDDAHLRKLIKQIVKTKHVLDRSLVEIQILLVK